MDAGFSMAYPHIMAALKRINNGPCPEDEAEILTFMYFTLHFLGDLLSRIHLSS